MARQLDRVLARVAFGCAENQCYRLVYRLSVKVYRAEVRGISRRLAQRLSGNRRKDLIRNGYCVAARNADYAYTARRVRRGDRGNRARLFHGVHLFHL